MKMIAATLTLLVAQIASANVMNIRLVPCTNSMESICAKVYEDYTAAANYKGTEMAFVADGETRAQVNMLAQKVGGQTLQVEGKTFTVFDGRTSKIQIHRVLKVVESKANFKQTNPPMTVKYGTIRR